MEAYVLLGDFNNIRVLSKRKGESLQNYGDLDKRVFNCFIEDMGLEDLPLIGRRFTWTRPNGKSISRIDRMLVSKEWLDLWEGSSLRALNQKFSDHCSLVLKNQKFDWGPRLFRFLNCWLEDTDFKTFMEEKWRVFNVIRRGAFVLKEKLKLLKKEIGAWNKNQFGDLNAKKKILE